VNLPHWVCHTNVNSDKSVTQELTNESVGLRRAWHPVLRLSELGNLPIRVELLGDAWVVVRLNGKICVFLDKCPHRNGRLSNGVLINDTLQCPYHGWRFGDSGRCVLIPALGEGATTPPTADLAPVRVQVKYDMVWIAPEAPVCDILHVPDWDDPSLSKVWMPPVTFAASAGQFVDNFLDVSHFPFVHYDTFGAGTDPYCADYEMSRGEDGWTFSVDMPHTIANTQDPLVETGQHPIIQDRTMQYTFGAPFNLSLRLHIPLTGMINTISSFCQPLDNNRTTLHQVMIRNDCPTDADADRAIEYQTRVFDEDLKVIEFLFNKTIPLERGQAHTRVDRNTVEFRRIMTRLLSV